MPRFLAVYSLQPEDLAKFRALPKSEQDRIDNEGIALWKVWEQQHAAAFADPGGMVGKTTRMLYQAYADAGFDPKKMPIASLCC